MKVCFFGGYDPAYPRNAILRQGLRLQGVRVAECGPARRFKFWLRYPALTAGYVRACRGTDVVFIPEFRHKDVPLGRFLSALSSKRVVFDPLASRYETKISDWKRNPAHSWQAGWNRTIDRWSFRLAHLLLSDTGAHGDYYARTFGVPRSKVEVLPVGYDDRLFQPRPAVTSRDSGFLVLFVGSFLPLHGVENIIRAAGLVAGRDPAVRFELVGSGQTFESARSLSARLGLSNVSFRGWTDLQDLPDIIAGADLCLGLFGETEKAGRVVPHKVFQAMGMGKPVLTAGTPAAREFFSHRETVYLCSHPYAESLAEAVLELRGDVALRERLSEKGLRLVQERYSPRPLGRRLTGILAGVVRRGEG